MYGSVWEIVLTVGFVWKERVAEDDEGRKK